MSMSERRKPAYQREPSELSDAIWTAGHATPLQLFRIGAWKSARGLAPLSLNTERDIRERTAATLESLSKFRHVDVLTDETDWDQWEKVAGAAIGSKSDKNGLLGLEGVGYPMATAIASILSPTAFPVMDKWTIQAIFGSVPTSRWQKKRAYRAFTERLVELAPTTYPQCGTVHEVDQAVMNSMMGCAEVRESCTHVAFPVITIPHS